MGYIFNYFFTYILPAVVKMMGGKGDSILASSKWAWVAIVIVCAGQSVAMNTIIYISGLQTVPEEYTKQVLLMERPDGKNSRI